MSPRAFNFDLGGLLALAAAVALMGPFAHGQSIAVSSAPLGGTSMTAPGGSDTLLSAPLQRPAVWVGTVASVAGNVIAANGSPGWTAGQWVYAAGSQSNTYYLLLTSGTNAGHAYAVTANDSGSVTVTLGSDSLASVAVGDAATLIPYWTLGTLFPAASAGSAFVVTTAPATPQTTIFLTAVGSPGINLAGTGYYFYAGAWRLVGGDPTVDQSDVVIRSDLPFKVRNLTTGTTLATAGTVGTGAQATWLSTSANASQDNPVAAIWPLPVSLNNSGLALSGAVANTTSVVARTDLILVFDNTATGFNKAASTYYFYYRGGWRKLGQPLTQDFGADVVFSPTSGVVIRKGATAAGSPVLWANPSP